MRERRGGLKVMMERPGTTLMLCINLYIAWVLYSRPVRPEEVSISYQTFMERGEYWRAISASLAHYEIMHLLFNMMSLYNLGDLEIVVGSFAYLNYTADLIVLTILAAMAMYHLLIYYQGQERYRTQSAVGYSCVLFAWMVVAALRMDRYCPIPGFESLCFNTYRLPLPFLGNGGTLAFNAAPFVLLFLTSFIMPNASMVRPSAPLPLCLTARFTCPPLSLLHRWGISRASSSAILWPGISSPGSPSPPSLHSVWWLQSRTSDFGPGTVDSLAGRPGPPSGPGAPPTPLPSPQPRRPG